MKQLLFKLFNKLNKHLDFLIKEFHQIEDIDRVCNINIIYNLIYV